MNKEYLQAFEEISKELYIYKDFADLFFDIFDLEYSKEKCTLNLKVKEPYDLENIDLNICLINEDADKILEVAKLLESEVNDSE